MFASIVKSSAFSGLASVSSYLLLILLARTGSPETFASFSYAVLCGLLLVLAIDCAADQCGSHFILSFSDLPEIDALRSIYTIKALVACAVVVLIVAVNVNGAVKVPYTALLFIIPAFNLGPLFEFKGKNMRFAALLAAEKLVLLVICAIYVKLIGFDIGIYVAYFVVSCGSLVIQSCMIGPISPKEAVWRPDLIVEYLSRYWPVYVALFAQATYGHASRLIIEARLGLLVFASVSLALQTINALSIIQAQFDRHFRPEVNRVVASLDINGLAALLLRYLFWYVMPLCVVAGAVALAADTVVALLYGPKWAGAVQPLRILAPLIVTVPLLRFVEMVVVALRITRLGLAVNLGVAFALFGGLTLIPLERPLEDWLRIIVVMQALQVAIAGALVISVLRKRIPSIMALP